MNRVMRVLFGFCILLFSQFSTAEIIPSSQYSLTALTASWAWGQTDFNASCSGSGAIDNVADLAAVDTMLSNGYVELSSNCGEPYNGIYPWPSPGELHTIEFSMAGGANVSISQLSFISSRSYSDTTVITVDYAVDGGSWLTAVTTTSGDMGITTGTPARTYTLDVGDVVADQFRITTAGDQVAFHEVMIDDGGIVAPGDAISVPTLSTLGLGMLMLLLSGLGWVFIRRS